MSTIPSGEYELVLQQTRELVGAFRQAADRNNISENEFWIWYSLIVLEGEQSQQEICMAWSLRKQTVNNIIKGMVRKGYVSLRSVPGTRNRKRIFLTPRGRAYGEAIVLPVSQAEKRAFGRMPREERACFLQLLKKYVTFLQQEMQVQPG